MAAVLAFGTVKTADAAPAEAMTWPDSPPPPPPPRAHVAPPPAPETERERMNRLLRSDSEIGAQYRRGRGMIIGGSVSLGVAGASLLSAGVFALVAEIESIPSDTDDDLAPMEETSSREIAIGFAITSGVLVAIGIPLIALGARDRSHAMERAKRRAWLGTGPRGFGLRF